MLAPYDLFFFCSTVPFYSKRNRDQAANCLQPGPWVTAVVSSPIRIRCHLFVCYHAVTALTERFCQNAKIRPILGWRRRRPVASAEPRGRARQEQLVGGQVGSASRKPCTRAPSFGPRPDVAVRSLPPRTRLRFSSLLGDAILFLDLHHGIPAATSA